MGVSEKSNIRSSDRQDLPGRNSRNGNMLGDELGLVGAGTLDESITSSNVERGRNTDSTGIDTSINATQVDDGKGAVMAPHLEQQDTDEKDGAGKKKWMTFGAVGGLVATATALMLRSVRKTDDNEIAGPNVSGVDNGVSGVDNAADATQEAINQSLSNAQSVAREMALQAAQQAASSAAAATTAAAAAATASGGIFGAAIGSIAGASTGVQVGVVVAIAAVTAVSVSTGVVVSENRAEQSQPIPTTRGNCSDTFEVKDGRLAVEFADLFVESIPDDNVLLLERNFVKLYNEASDTCNELYEREMLEAKLVSWEVEVKNSLNFTKLLWEARVTCTGCFDMEPLFYYNDLPESARNLVEAIEYKNFTEKIPVSLIEFSSPFGVATATVLEADGPKQMYINTLDALTGEVVDAVTVRVLPDGLLTHVPDSKPNHCAPCFIKCSTIFCPIE
ncbi:predicted protein [Phaeodactylum tricornutum CCAP 1055/1]|uniref:Uncharacterized protein n=2 Tax=Phaeodactylum tricornutum TaxID=2850 RepID=B5Y3A3_PHATC|nr:predicted protein [Phaeodactylum tricornutum CCAP 1055/1]ACI65084.1 predicted protein [Phaeodactylum tricornutum CCAP 1055/1]|eukprot:XP_002185614.1 predicted protein [Phaeodactylum tricornutum CCAP 1055/1]